MVYTMVDEVFGKLVAEFIDDELLGCAVIHGVLAEGISQMNDGIVNLLDNWQPKIAAFLKIKPRVEKYFAELSNFVPE